MKRRKPAVPITFTCRWCGKVKTILPSQGKEKYCSSKCSGMARRNPDNYVEMAPKIYRLETERRCNICHKIIQEIPGDVDPRYVRFCYKCREFNLPDIGRADEWIGCGEERGASLGQWRVR